jgi:hypothetical protein
VVSIPSRGKGVFALRKSLKVAKGTICDLRRNPDNPHGQNALIRLEIFNSVPALHDFYKNTCVVKKTTLRLQ